MLETAVRESETVREQGDSEEAEVCLWCGDMGSHAGCVGSAVGSKKSSSEDVKLACHPVARCNPATRGTKYVPPEGWSGRRKSASHHPRAGTRIGSALRAAVSGARWVLGGGVGKTGSAREVSRPKKVREVRVLEKLGSSSSLRGKSSLRGLGVLGAYTAPPLPPLAFFSGNFGQK